MAATTPDLPKDPEPKMNRLTTLEDAVLRSLAKNTQFVAAFPFLASLNNPVLLHDKGGGVKGCTPCQRNKLQNQVSNQVKAQIANMSVEDKQKLKQMLNTKQARVTYDSGAGRIVQKTF